MCLQKIQINLKASSKVNAHLCNVKKIDGQIECQRVGAHLIGQTAEAKAQLPPQAQLDRILHNGYLVFVVFELELVGRTLKATEARRTR